MGKKKKNNWPSPSHYMTILGISCSQQCPMIVTWSPYLYNVITFQILCEMAEEILQKVEDELNCRICFDVYEDPKLLQLSSYRLEMIKHNSELGVQCNKYTKMCTRKVLIKILQGESDECLSGHSQLHCNSCQKKTTKYILLFDMYQHGVEKVVTVLLDLDDKVIALGKNKSARVR